MTKDQVRSTEEALDLAMESLEHMLEDAKQERLTVEYWNECVDAIAAIKQALAAPYVATPLVQESEKRECMNCAAFGECNPNNDAGRCGYEPPAAPVQEPEWKQIAEDLRFHGLTLVKTATGYAVLKLCAVQAQATPPAAPVQEPVKVGRITDNIKGMVLRQEVMLYTDDYLPIGTAIYTTPPAAQRQWVGLTDEEILKLAYPIRWQEVDDFEADKAVNFAQTIEAKLKEKNT